MDHGEHFHRLRELVQGYGYVYPDQVAVSQPEAPHDHVFQGQEPISQSSILKNSPVAHNFAQGTHVYKSRKRKVRDNLEVQTLGRVYCRVQGLACLGGMSSRNDADVVPELSYSPVYRPDEGQDHGAATKKKERRMKTPSTDRGVKDLTLQSYRVQYNASVRDYQAALSRVALEDGEAAIADVNMLTEIKSGSRSLQKAVTDLQANLHAKLAEGEKLRLAQEISRLRKDKAELEAASRAELARVEKQAQANLQAAEAAYRDEIEFAREEIKEATQLKYDRDVARVEADAQHEAQACKICMEKPHNVILFPCFHAQYCEDCLEKHRKNQNTCPTCRTNITGTVRYIL